MFHRPLAATAIALLVCLSIAVQWHSGAWHGDLDGDPDEAAHAVSSLMIRDYVAEGFPGNPIRYAEAYYVHYPKVAIGHWPPLFHAGEAGWMLAFGRSRAAMIAFTAAISIALSLSVFAWLRRTCGTVPALLAAVALVVTPFIQAASWTVSPNMLLALLAFWAAVVYGKYLDTSRRRYLVLFGFLAAACAATHSRGFAVALIPLVIWLFEGRRRLTVWRIITILLAIAIMLIVPHRLHQAFPPSFSAAVHTSWCFLRDLCVSMGLPVVLLAIIGGVRIRRLAVWRPMLALAIAVWIFLALIYVGWEDRFLTTAAPAIACLAGAGVAFLWQYVRRPGKAWKTVLATAAIIGVAVWSVTAVRFEPKRDLGYHRLAAIDAKVLMAAGDPFHEGALITEIALRDPHRERVVLRSSKMLFQSTWIGTDYRLLFHDPDAVSAALDRFHVELIAVQTADPDPDIGQLLEAVSRHPVLWREKRMAKPPSGVRLFGRIGPAPQGSPQIRIDMHNRLGAVLELSH